MFESVHGMKGERKRESSDVPLSEVVNCFATICRALDVDNGVTIAVNHCGGRTVV